MINITPLEAWIREKARIDTGLTGRFFVEALQDYQLRRLNEIIDYARHNTHFYRAHLASVPTAPLSALSDLTRIPFTNPSDLSRNPSSFLAVRQDDIARIVTLRTSGSTGEAKRLFFTEEDLELTVDFFHHGMSTLVRPGQRVVILLPGERPDSVGDLLVRGLRRMDVQALAYGPVTDPLHAAEAIASFGAHCLVGIPTQVFAVARSRTGAAIGKGSIESVLLSTDYVPRAIAKTLEEVWGCRVFNHYGMTEMGLGGGVECEALVGYHLREADLHFEVVDHETGEACPDGIIGEVVFTTLTRQAMPLIRYRTGDIARIIPQPCPCGSVLRRMDYVRGRWDGAVRVAPECTLSLSDMDEALFRLPDLLDYRAIVSKGKGGKFGLHIDIYSADGGNPTDREVLQCLIRVDAIRKATVMGNMETPTVRFSAEGRWTTTGVAKRKIVITQRSEGDD
jgi:phenylacetate-coenzyme A ligase PaaK-like adenylate-forming protein